MFDLMREGGFCVAIAWVGGMILFPFFIHWQRRKSVGQKIKKEGPALHPHKENTPSMGGVIVFLSAFLASFVQSHASRLFPYLWALLGFFLLGLLDDYWKSFLGYPWGLKARYRFLVEVLLAFGVMWWGRGIFPHVLVIPFTGRIISLSPLALFLYGVFLLVASCNAFNITDGLDGLAAGCGILTFIFWGVLLGLADRIVPALLSFSFVGGLLAFLWFNSWPADIFLGDSGSLTLGALMGILALSSGHSLLLAFSGVVFVVDTLSVVLQVVSFQIFGKRIFLMSPLHHHFELRGEKEVRITARLWLVQALGVLLAFLGVGR